MNEEQVTDATAGAAVASPFLIPLLELVSVGAAWLLPVLGVVWLAMRIVHKLWYWRSDD